jgi:hypothetical protein
MNQENGKENVRTRVFRALGFALDNGYEDFLRLPAVEVANDLLDFDADLESEDADELVPLVSEWRVARGWAS